MVLDILAFVLCAAVITFSGTRLSQQGDKFVRLTGLSKAWVGLVLMATVTSLPELVTGISAVTVVHAPDLAAGNVLGSCAFNLLILSLLDLFMKKPLSGLVQTSHVVTGAFSIILLSLAGVAIYSSAGLSPFFWISPVSVVLIATYFLAVRAIFMYEKSHTPQRGEADPVRPAGPTIRTVLAVYALHAFVVVLAALFLPYLGERIAMRFHVTDTLFGTIFLAAATSLPEVVVSVSALRLNAPDMAMGNLLGSNVFNVAILGLLDFFYSTGPLYGAVSGKHILSIFSSIAMTAIVAVGIMIRPERKWWRLSIDGWIILIVYLINILLLR